MKSGHFRYTVPAAALIALSVTPALAQRQPTPEQRIDRLERQLRQVQGRVFPNGQPASTAGFLDQPAATQASVSNLDNRLTALERQVADMIRLSEETAHGNRQLQAEIERLRSDQQSQIRALEARLAAAATAAPAIEDAGDDRPRPIEDRRAVEASSDSESGGGAEERAAAEVEADPGEEAYSDGFRLWRDGKYDQAIASLRAFTSSFPKHRRVSFANNLAGRAMLDKGEPRAAAEALLANYRSDPRGERAADSLYYLGQALMKLDQPSQACKAYAELEEVYGSAIRDELKELLPDAKAEAGCS